MNEDIQARVLSLVMDLVDETTKSKDPRYADVADVIVREWVLKFKGVNLEEGSRPGGNYGEES